jgi:hypothetical protein
MADGVRSYQQPFFASPCLPRKNLEVDWVRTIPMVMYVVKLQWDRLLAIGQNTQGRRRLIILQTGKGADGRKMRISRTGE